MFRDDSGLSTGRPDRPDRSRGRGPLVPSAVLAMLVFVAVEIMFFAGLISAFLIGKAGAVGWPPLGQPRLPVEVTAVNTAILLASGALLWRAARVFGSGRGPWSAGALLMGSVALGTCFVGLQGWEWVRLIGYGLTLTSSTYGSFFYLVVGAHALHAGAALVALAWAGARLRLGRLAPEALGAVSIFWYFVVGVWPILYTLVYLL